MDTKEFIQKFGWEKAIQVSSASNPEWVDHYHISGDSHGTAGKKYSKLLCENNDDFVCIHDLKRYVDAYELVQSYGGVNRVKEAIAFKCNDTARLKQAIQLVESVNAEN